MTDLAGDDLIAGDARLDVDGGLLHLHAGQVRSRAPAMIARPIQQRAAAVVRQVSDLDHVVAKRLERLEDSRQLRRQHTLLRHVPVLHVDAVGHVQEGQAHRGFRRGSERRHHRIEERKGNRSADALQKGPAGDGLAGNDHGITTSFRSQILQRNRFRSQILVFAFRVATRRSRPGPGNRAAPDRAARRHSARRQLGHRQGIDLYDRAASSCAGRALLLLLRGERALAHVAEGHLALHRGLVHGPAVGHLDRVPVERRGELEGDRVALDGAGDLLLSKQL
jgi:hypothetical protein